MGGRDGFGILDLGNAPRSSAFDEDQGMDGVNMTALTPGIRVLMEAQPTAHSGIPGDINGEATKEPPIPQK